MPKTLLLADDSVVIQKLVGLSFANEDVELIITDNGDDAVAKARESRPDIVLADVVMPGMSGYEVCQSIRTDSDLAGTPVLLLTGTFEAFDEERARQVGSNGHITKPFEAAALVERVNTLLAESAAAGPATTAPQPNDALDFFEDDSTDLSGEPGLDATNVSPATELRAASTPEAPSIGANAADDLGSGEPSFAFGLNDEPPPSLPDSDLLDDPLERPAAAPAPDHTVALMPDTDSSLGAASAPLGADPSPLGGQGSSPGAEGSSPGAEGSPLGAEGSPLGAEGSPLGAEGSSVGAGGPAADSPTMTAMPADAAGAPSLGDSIPDINDLDLAGLGLTGAAPEPLSAPPPSAAPVAAEQPSHAQPPVPPAHDLSAQGDSSHTTVIMSGGDTSSDGIQLGDQASPPVSLDMPEPRPYGAEPPSASEPAPPEPLAAAPRATAAEPVTDLDPAIDLTLTPNPDETMLADELFSDGPGPEARDLASELAGAAPAGTDDIFDFGSSSSAPSAPDHLLDGPEGSSPTPPLAEAYDVSSSDLGDPLLMKAGGRGLQPTGDDLLGIDDPLDDAAGPGPALDEIGQLQDAGPLAPPTPVLAEAQQAPQGEPSGSGPDITPVMRDRIHETLERVAWESFGDISEKLVKTVLDRVEAICWEVIPQMAEALIKEEIRRMKGDPE